MPAVDAVLILRERQTKAYEALNKAKDVLVDAEHAHGAMLADGEEPDRDIVTDAKADIDLAKKAVEAVEDDLSHVHSGIIDHETTLMIDTAVADIERDTKARPDLNESLARNVAELRLRLAVAEAEHGKALAEIEGVRGRVDDIDQRIGEITKKRLQGDATAGSAAELAALDYDIRALREVMGQAQPAGRIARPVRASGAAQPGNQRMG